MYQLPKLNTTMHVNLNRLLLFYMLLLALELKDL